MEFAMRLVYILTISQIYHDNGLGSDPDTNIEEYKGTVGVYESEDDAKAAQTRLDGLFYSSPFLEQISHQYFLEEVRLYPFGYLPPEEEECVCDNCVGGAFADYGHSEN
jgi:hypothetical protein